ncbi:hypothetical protein [Mesorhizobium sp. WSM3876]|uniref:hypothetical protein n=1 Tax=Mesorhizobium sp. WSM3876 TaxID=422277 RepID=UPI000BAF9AA5|nr:hypothetical protein [Mesorhizobium sp. WSM3876]PBB85729.1 hypothetical protein CK216_16510 [Mesorhizobium sp. WSM3876]
MRELKSHLASRQSLAPLLRTVTATGTRIDRAGFESVTFVVHVGAWTDGVHTISFEHSDDDISYDAVIDNDPDFPSELVGDAPVIQGDGESPVAATFSNENILVGYIGDRQYVRPKVTVTGGPATGAFVGIDVILGHAARRPT